MALTLPVAMPKKVRPASEFGERLMALRKARGLTQIRLAEMIDSTQRAISRCETVADRAPAPALANLAKAMHVSTDELLGLEPSRSANGHDTPEARAPVEEVPPGDGAPRDGPPRRDPPGQLVGGDQGPLGGGRVAMSQPKRRASEEELLAKIRRLAPERVAEVEDFVDFLRLRDEEQQLTRAASQLSEAAFAKVWDHPDDADYDRL